MRVLRRLSTLSRRVRSAVRRRRVEQDLDDEIRDHLERRIEADLARGLTPEEARAAAMRAFGGVEQSKEACRDVHRVNPIDETFGDIRFACRYFARTPATSVTMVLVLALGIGFNAALFLLIQSFVSGPVPAIPRHESLVRIRGIDRTTPGRAIGREFSYPEYLEYAAQRTLFSDVAAWTSSDVVIDVGTAAPDLQSGAATYVTSRYFPVLGIRPIRGAGLPVDVPDAGGAPTMAAVISHVLWERHFDRAPDVVGRTLAVNGTAFTIVGVAPRRFAGARTGGSQIRVWLPLNTRPQVQGTAPTRADYDDARFGLVARLQPGIRAKQTGPAVQAIAARTARHATRGPSAEAAFTDVVPLLGNNYFPPSGTEEGPSAGPYLTLLFPLLVLLITCTNVSALLAGLAVARRREIAVRLALGAARGRVIRQLVIESVMLAIAAGTVGLCVIWLLVRVFDASIPSLEIEFDGRGLAFTFGLAIATGIVFGISPALHATRLALSEVLKDSAGTVAARRLRLQSLFVVAQIAFTQPALLLMGAAFLELQADLRELPSQPFAERILAVHFNTNPRYGVLDREREETLRRLETRLAAVPGVAGVVAQESSDDYFEIEPHPADRIAGTDLQRPLAVRTVAAPAGYFPLMDMPFVRGRDFDATDRNTGSVVVIGAALARQLWDSADPVGRRLVVADSNRGGPRTFTVVGVVDGSSAERPGGNDTGRLFVPSVRTTGHLLVRMYGPAEPLLPTIRAVAADEAPALPIVAAQTLAAIEAEGRRSIVAAIAAAGGIGGLALLLSAIGLYAVTAFAIGQRVREIGIRTALGAGCRQVVALFIWRGLRLGLIGLAIGLSLSIAGVRLLSAMNVDGPPAGTASVTVLVAVFVIGVAVLASWIPARRAARVDPIEALRVE